MHLSLLNKSFKHPKKLFYNKAMQIRSSVMISYTYEFLKISSVNLRCNKLSIKKA